ncbi:MAG: hypothetical protein J6C40_02200 [Lentisphaeria bacterium]|nr:hypothetical protein [Lentisphaeria bacterium]
MRSSPGRPPEIQQGQTGADFGIRRRTGQRNSAAGKYQFFPRAGPGIGMFTCKMNTHNIGKGEVFAAV